jgi:UDP-N-acetyl-D-mannosaminuronate dehydrogenase
VARIAFIGLGNMGGGMAANLAQAGHDVRAFDLSADALDRARYGGSPRPHWRSNVFVVRTLHGGDHHVISSRKANEQKQRRHGKRLG